MTFVDQLGMYVRLARHLRGYLQQPPWTTKTASETIAAALRDREQRFLRIVREQAYNNPCSPYYHLLSQAGCELEDLRRSVRENGLEQTLEQLRGAGVFVTFDELKGLVPIRRGSMALDVHDCDFDNCHGSPDFFVQTTGSTRTPAHVPAYLVDLAEDSAYWPILREGLSLENHRMATWYPLGGVSIRALLSYRRTGTIDKWFSLTDPALEELPLRYRWSSRLMTAACRILGSSLPMAEPAGLEHLDRIIDWCRSGGPACVRALTSSVVRLCRRALKRGVDLSETCLVLSGEPLSTEGRLVIEHSGATKAALYATAETGPLGFSCAAPGAEFGDYHVRTDRFAVIQDAADQTCGDTRALLLTTLAPHAGKFFLNAQIGDAGTIHGKPCGCYLEHVGWSQHVTALICLSKIVTEGMSVPKSKLTPVLQEVLPARLGGRAEDYQLVQKRDPDGIERLELWVTPELRIRNGTNISNVFMDALTRIEPSMQVVVDVWRQAQSVRVVRAAPRPVNGKFPTIRIERG